MDTGRRHFLKRSLGWGAGCLLASTLPTTVSTLWGQSSATNQYKVQSGDTLSGIAQQFKVSIEEIRSLNKIKGDQIFVGQVLQIPDSISSAKTTIRHKVRRGDTLSGIAQHYGTTVRSIKSLNNLKSDTINVGQELIIESNSKQAQAPSYRYIEEVVRVTRGLKIQPGHWKWIVGHHSGIRHGNATSYDRAHRRRGMTNGLAYHFVIGNGVDSGDGEVEIGGRWKQQLQGGHVRSHQVNMAGIGICLVGNFEETRPTSKQIEAFIELVSFLKNDVLAGQTVKFAVHKEIEPNLCPGKNFPLRAMHQMFG